MWTRQGLAYTCVLIFAAPMSLAAHAGEYYDDYEGHQEGISLHAVLIFAVHLPTGVHVGEYYDDDEGYEDDYGDGGDEGPIY
jgi:hypothetical protein